ncbi:biopolymer transporter ExbD [Kordiimonas sp. SCSIO 12610]|uniref:ExbD/TolR family protein n=1 Tax=Kordiimonas sp. SCSIO 12610 TaxID=2829597 RepID=UPI00210B5390|nr:biopolymer transporter ExbD [Kordiimonas sp. SCSIO 12610]UTW55892.1 biopolymer transporter ExbD [Kordiimonas sp. SCSIO 12610]
MRDHSQQDDDTEINMTPMLDIVFIMLIFFIVTAVFVKDSGVEVQKPEAITAIPQKQISVLVAVTDNDEVHINREAVDVDAIRTIIEKLHSENPKGTIAIQADDKAKAGLVLDTYKAIKDAGVGKIAFATEVKS